MYRAWAWKILKPVTCMFVWKNRMGAYSASTWRCPWLSSSGCAPGSLFRESHFRCIWKQSMRMLTVSFKWYQSRVDICMHVCYGFSDLRCWWMCWLWFAWWMEWLIEEFWNCCVLHKETEHRFDALSINLFLDNKLYLMHEKRLLMLKMLTWICLSMYNCMKLWLTVSVCIHWTSVVLDFLLLINAWKT